MTTTASSSWIDRLPGRTCAFAPALLLCAVASPSLPAAPLQAQGMGPDPADAAIDIPIRFKHLGMADGLSQSTVNAMYQDPTGYLWVATESGLNRFDGYRFVVHERDREDPTALHEDYIVDLDGDDEGNIWVATRTGGIARLDHATGRWTTFRAGAPDGSAIAANDTRSLSLAPDGTLLVGYKANGLDRLSPQDGRVLRHFQDFDGDPRSTGDDFVEIALPLPDEQAWVGTNNGLYRLDLVSGRVSRADLESHLQEAFGDDSLRARVRDLMLDRQGRLWVATRHGGIFVLGRDGAVTQHHVADGAGGEGTLSSNDVAALLQDRAGRIWAATKGGLNLFRPERGDFAHYLPDPAEPTSLANVRLTSLLEDHTGLLWVGMQNAGLSFFNPRSWAFGHYRPAGQAGSNTRVITSFAEADGKLWMGTFGDGIHELSRSPVTGQVVRDRRLSLELGDDNVMTLATSASGTVWAGLMRGGLRRIDPATGAVQRWTHDDGDPATLSSNAVMTVYEDSRGVLWAGTHGGGLNRVDTDGSVRRITVEQGLSDNVAQVVREDRRGRIWVGTDGGGLNMLDGEGNVLAVLRSDSTGADSLASDNIYSIHVGEGDDIWAGGLNGLDRVVAEGDDPARFRYANYSKREGLSNNIVWGILPDRSGQLWLSTNFGLTRFDPLSGASRTFHEEHGLQGEDFNFGAYYVTRDGALCFGGSNGLNAFYPNRLQLNQVPPRTVLTSIARFNTLIPGPLHALDHLELGHDDDALTIEFAALDFAAPERNHYAYMLEGFDEDWVSKGAVRRATYTNLDRGHYVFRVRARNSDGFWSDEGVSLPITVAPAPWETWWAWLAYAVTAAAILYLLLRSQHQRRRREERYRQRLEHEVTERTRELAEQAEALRQLNARLEESSFTDPLTGLNNRRFLFDGIAGEISEIGRRHDMQDRSTPQALVFVMVDLDHFKPVNDAYGHSAGDSLLLQITQLLKDSCGPDDWIIRWGGDEFLVVGRLQAGQSPEGLVGRLRSAVANALFPVGSGRVARTTTSIGYARYPFLPEAPHHLSWEQVLNIADHAMYQAKESRNTYVGLEATARTLECDDLMLAISRDPAALVQDGLLRVVRPPEPPAQGDGEQRSA